ncbi:MAG: glycosyltransferase family 4 protein [Gemmatimonadaceae bacterium]|nr:glycosyltransferase family 4 protein [Gemmatimonadaceae bacterium]
MSVSARPLRVCVVNWQDRENPQAGGAETHLHEIFGRLADAGHDVTLLCGGWPGAPTRVTLDGMRVVRAGTRQSFAMRAWSAFRAVSREQAFDVVVEDINKVPLHTPWWGLGGARPVALVPHLFGATAFQELAAPLAAAVWMAERPIPLVYRGVPFQAISESTADDLVARGVRRDRIRVIFPGIDNAAYTPDATMRAPTPTFAYLGRLKRYKGVHLCLEAFARAAVPGAVFEVAGAGEYRADLERLAGTLGVSDRVRFLGRIDESEKRALLRRAWALLFASPKEGWGITNLEAGASGTPVIASNSPGIRESVRDGQTGFLVAHGDTEAMAGAIRRLAADRPLVERLGDAARVFAGQFTWDQAARQTAEHLREVRDGAIG